MKIFSIEGNIGSGKSTLLEFMKKNDRFVFLPEPVHTWNEIKDSSGVTILEKYYSDQDRYAFPFQMMAYITRLSLIRKAMKESPPDSIILTERSIFTDREIFAKMLHDSGKIEDISYSIYLRWFNEFSEASLDGIVYVQTTPDLCLQRTIQRNRKGEECIPLSYLNDCHRYHEEWINNTDIPVLYIDAKNVYTEEIIKKIEHFSFETAKKI
jgi:deoxyadenosine/deoxycytidine kinase